MPVAEGNSLRAFCRQLRPIPHGETSSISDAAPRQERNVIIPMHLMALFKICGLSNADATTSSSYRRPGPMPQPPPTDQGD